MSDAAQNPRNIQAGDKVRLISGGRVMAALRVYEDDLRKEIAALCAWHDDKGQPIEKDYPVVGLEKVDP